MKRVRCFFSFTPGLGDELEDFLAPFVEDGAISNKRLRHLVKLGALAWRQGARVVSSEDGQPELVYVVKADRASNLPVGGGAFGLPAAQVAHPEPSRTPVPPASTRRNTPETAPPNEAPARGPSTHAKKPIVAEAEKGAAVASALAASNASKNAASPRTSAETAGQEVRNRSERVPDGAGSARSTDPAATTEDAEASLEVSVALLDELFPGGAADFPI